MRKDERFDAIQTALKENSIGENQTDRVMMGLDLLCKKHRIEVPA